MDYQGVGLICGSLAVVIAGNIILDAVIGGIQHGFKLKEMLVTLVKGVVVIAVTGGLCILATMHPRLVSIATENTTVDFHDAVNLLFVGEIGEYGYRIISKLIKVFRLPYPTADGHGNEIPENGADHHGEEVNENGKCND